MRAQQKQRRNQKMDKTSSLSTSLSLLERLGIGEEQHESPPISGLPIRQVR